MAVNKVIMNTVDGENILIDLTSDTVTADKLAKGYTAHDASGNPITGTMESGSGGIPSVITAGDTPVLMNSLGILADRSESVLSTGISLTVSKAGTYRFKTYVYNEYSSEVSWGKYYSAIKFYRNGVSTDTYQTIAGKYAGVKYADIECQAGDTIEIYASSADTSYKTAVLSLSACISWDNGF